MKRLNPVSALFAAALFAAACNSKTEQSDKNPDTFTKDTTIIMSPEGTPMDTLTPPPPPTVTEIAPPVGEKLPPPVVKPDKKNDVAPPPSKIDPKKNAEIAPPVGNN